MAEPDREEEQPARETEHFKKKRDQGNEPIGEEEKVLAGRPDANIPALLTQDVPGG
jgi:hypothetical protein